MLTQCVNYSKQQSACLGRSLGSLTYLEGEREASSIHLVVISSCIFEKQVIRQSNSKLLC